MKIYKLTLLNGENEYFSTKELLNERIDYLKNIKSWIELGVNVTRNPNIIKSDCVYTKFEIIGKDKIKIILEKNEQILCESDLNAINKAFKKSNE
jgi:hypothetical protein